MTRSRHDNIDPPVERDTLETADAVARAAHMWIRSLCLGEMQEEDERYALAGGLVAGLCERLELNPRVRELVAYVYTLLNNEGGHVAPGPVDTPLLRSFVPDGDLDSGLGKAFQRAIPMRRLGQPDDIPGIVAFLASNDANFITGQVVSVSGGLTMHG